MKHRLPTPKTLRAKTELKPVGQPELLAEESSLLAAPAALPPPLPIPSPSLNNVADSTALSEPAPSPIPPVQAAPPAKRDAEAEDSFSFLSGSDTPAPVEMKVLKPFQKAKTSGLPHIAPIAPAENPVTPSASVPVQPPVEIVPTAEKPVEPPPAEKAKTKRLEPPALPAEENGKNPPPVPLAQVDKPAEPAGWLSRFLASWKQEPPDDPEPSPEFVRPQITSMEDIHTTAPVTGRDGSIIHTTGLVKQYAGRRVVNGVDIYVKPGEVVGLLGRNGAGKTTTFYMIVGLVSPTYGHVFMGDEDVTRMPMYRRARRGIGYLPQEESIFRKLTVEENLLAILETLPLTEEERDARCDTLLKDFGLEHVRENVAITLSGGEKRRVTIARALVTSPTLLLLDEPFAGVDPMAVHDIQEIILHLKERGLGVLITDHSVRETLSVVDRAYIIDEGRVLSEGTREFLLNDPVAREIYLGHRFSM